MQEQVVVLWNCLPSVLHLIGMNSSYMLSDPTPHPGSHFFFFFVVAPFIDYCYCFSALGKCIASQKGYIYIFLVVGTVSLLLSS